MTRSLPTIVLLGAGHAHLGIIDDWLKRGPPDARTVLIEPRDAMQYSGMVPGWLAGEYTREESSIALAPLVAAAGIVWHRCAAIGIDPDACTVSLDSGETIAFDLCSIATGGIGRAAAILSDDERVLDIRPIDRFMDRWEALRDAPEPPRRIAVVGGGAGGIELAFGLRNSECAPEVTLVAGHTGVLLDHSRAAHKRVRREFFTQAIALRAQDARLDRGTLQAGGDPLDPPDLIVAAIGSAAPTWPRTSGLPVDRDGFIRVGPTQQVEGYPQLFAAGDIARRTDRAVSHSGVHAVYTGPVLAKNLRRSLAGRTDLARYRPWGMDFYLLNTCRRQSILSYGPIGLKARWLRRLKDWLDRRWIARFTDRDGPR